MAHFWPHPHRRPAVVAGASSGIGEHTARLIGSRGHPVVLGARRLERCRATADYICAQGGEAHAVVLDLTDRDSVDDFLRQSEGLVGPIDIAVLSSGQSAPDGRTDAFEALVAVNLVGVHRFVEALLPGMRARQRGDVVFVSSEVVRAPRPGTSGYVASKWGAEGYARTLQMQLEGTGVRASIVQPGQAATEMGGDWDPAETTAILEEWIRWGIARHSNFLTPAAVAQAVMHAVETPPGTHLTLIEVQPVAPVHKPLEESS